jgi:hypothetical protein
MNTTTTNDSPQTALASELGVSPRRVRQLIAEGILPGPNEAGTYDLERCVQQHALFLARHDAGAWAPFEDRLLRAARRVERLLATAVRPAASGPQLQAASVAVQGLFSDLSFMTVCRSKTPAERDLFLRLWREKENRALGALVARVAADR